MLKRRNKNNHLVDHCCTATYIHKSISLHHHTIDKTYNMPLHIKKNTHSEKEENTYTHTNTNDRLDKKKENDFKKNTHTEQTGVQQCVATNRKIA
jgi:hypothetical protein